MTRATDMVGMHFGRLKVIERAPRASRSAYWLCQCDCGNIVPVRGANLRCGKTKSCGCLHDELSAKRISEQNRTHGESDTRLYSIWSDMKKRCDNENHWAYARYGGRGIGYDIRWTTFESFSEWAKSNGYSSELTLDRENNDNGYSPDNCRWVSRKEQGRNKSNNVRFENDGKFLTLGEWSEMTGIPYTTLHGRIYNYGWSVERALTTPTRRHVLHGTKALPN